MTFLRWLWQHLWWFTGPIIALGILANLFVWWLLWFGLRHIGVPW